MAALFTHSQIILLAHARASGCFACFIWRGWRPKRIASSSKDMPPLESCDRGLIDWDEPPGQQRGFGPKHRAGNAKAGTPLYSPT